jgi:kynurenine formamidase
MPQIFDLTRPLNHLGPSTHTQPRPVIFQTVTHDSTRDRYGGALSIASMGFLLSDHAGTHVDAWTHLTDEPGAASIDRMPLSDFVARAVVIDVTDAQSSAATGEQICTRVTGAIERHRVEAVLFRTGAVRNALADPEGYLEGFRGIGADVVLAAAARGIRLIGTDARSLDPASAERGPDGLPAHRACLEKQVVVCENLDLVEAPDDQPFLFLALPLRLTGCTGSPVRAVALLDYS